MTDMVRWELARRLREAYVDPAPLLQNAINAVNAQLPVTAAALRSYNYPGHKLQQEILYDGKHYLAWVKVYEGAKYMPLPRGRRRDPDFKPKLLRPAHYVALVVMDNGQDVREYLVEANQEELENGEGFRDFTFEGKPVTGVWSIHGFLEALAKPPKRDPWDA